MDERNGGPSKVKVVDRRKFTADGEPRELERTERPAPDRAAGGPQRPPVKQDPAPERSPGAGGPPSGTPEPGPSRPPETSSRFLGLVAMLTQHAELLLLGAEGLPPRPDEARTVIDFLGVLEEKTTGNLTRQEGEALSSVLYQLRALYVQKKP